MFGTGRIGWSEGRTERGEEVVEVGTVGCVRVKHFHIKIISDA